MTAFTLNTNVLELTGLRNEIDGAWINDATVQATVVDLDGEEVAGETWPLSMPYVAASNGVYRALLVADLALTAGRPYRAIITVDAGDGIEGRWELRFKPRKRTD